MSDFGMVETDDGLTAKMEHTGNLDAKTFVLGKGMLWKNNLSKNFSIVSEV